MTTRPHGTKSDDVATARRRRRAVNRGDVVRLLLAWASSAVTLMVTASFLDGLVATSTWSWVAVAAVSAVVGLLVRPAMVATSARIGWLAVLLVALCGQAAVLGLAIGIVPGVESASFGTTMAAAWISAAVGTAVAWLTSAGTDDSLATSLLRKPAAKTVSDPDVPGVVFVQIDGVPFPVLRWAVQGGSVPTMRRWLASGGYELHEWVPQIPCTTPATQLGLLHGTVAGIPAFRWYDRPEGRVVVSNRPADAALIEGRATDGRGLLADDGVSVSNLFSGDAPRTAMTMSKLEVARGSSVTRKAVAWYLARPDGLARSITRTFAEVVKERFQARRQERRALDPRTHRGWTFAALRAITNGLIRDLNTAVVADEMLRGTKSIYVDYVDYDEIAHHAGIFRPESLAALDGIDRALAALEAVAEKAPRPYLLVVVSDHGQSQGTPFAARVGYDLGTLCRQLVSGPVHAVESDTEGWGRTASAMEDIAGAGGATAGAARRAGRAAASHVDQDVSEPADDDSELTVLGSGNLALIYQAGPRRLTLSEIESRWPRLVPGLVQHEGISLVAALGDDGHALVLGPNGRRDLTTGTVTGEDPVAAFGPHAAELLRRAVLMPEAPDLYINSDVHPATLDVSAFEPLVGCHGGLGGWQTSAVLLWPSAARELGCGPGEEPVVGADAMHRQFVDLLERLGHRSALTGTGSRSEDDAAAAGHSTA